MQQPILENLPKATQRIHLALEEAKGDRALAADLLEMTPREITDKIHASAFLKAAWSKSAAPPPPPNTIQSIQAPPPPPLKSEVAMQEDKDRLRAGLKKIGLKAPNAQLGADLYEFQVKNGAVVMAQLGGGLVRSAMMLQAMMDRLTKEKYGDESTPDGLLLRDGQRATDEMILKCQAEYGKRVMEHAQMVLLHAKTRKLLEGGSGNGNRPHGKPAFGEKIMRPPE